MVMAVLVVPIVMAAFPLARYIIAFIICFFIYETVENAIGNSVITYIITLVLIYFLVWKYIYLTSSLMMVYLFLGFGLMSVLTWGTAKLSK